MALSKLITLDNGVQVNYHRIESVALTVKDVKASLEIPELKDTNPGEANADVASLFENADEDSLIPVNLLRAVVLGYVSENIRRQNTEFFVTSREYSFTIPSDDTGSNLRAVAYAQLKQQLEYQGASDC